MITKTEGERETRTNTVIKQDITCKMEVDKKETEPHNMTDHDMEKRLHYYDK